MLDVDATVDLYGDTGLLFPLQHPAWERWFDVTVIVDAGPTMDVWRDSTTALSQLLIRRAIAYA
ncbi:hypothetical protein [Actinophytocola sp.]|uniref:hypothetical protein n=1 Tax=Actinophytocola sp. TaxID=1872138 RepID=UPI003899DCAD